MSARFVTRLILATLLGVVSSVSGWAQYGGGSPSPTTGTTGTSGGGYSSSTGIAIGAGAAAGVAVAYLALHKASIAGCVEPSSDGVKLMDEKDKKTYALIASAGNLTPGHRVQLRGKKSKDSSGKPVFRVEKLTKEYGDCK